MNLINTKQLNADSSNSKPSKLGEALTSTLDLLCAPFVFR